MNPFFEGEEPALMQTVDEPKEKGKKKYEYLCPNIVLAFFYGLCYKSNKGVIAFARRKCM